MRRYMTIIMVSALLVTMAVFTAGCGGKYSIDRKDLSKTSPWPFNRYQQSALGAFPDGSFNGQLNVIWEGAFGGKPVGPLTIVHDALVCPSSKKKIRFYNPATGQYLGKLKCKGIPQTGVAVADSLAFYSIAPETDRLSAVNLLNGHIIWERDIKDAAAGPIIVKNSLFISSGSGRLYSLATGTGLDNWTFQADGGLTVSASYADGKIYQPGDQGVLYALSEYDGSELFQTTLDGPIASPVAIGDLIYVTDVTGSVYGLDRESGLITWKKTIPAPVWTSPAVAGNKVFIGASGGQVVALDAANGNELWQFDTDEVVKASPVAVGNFVVVGTAGGTLIVLDAGTGTETARTKLDGSIDFSPVTDGTRVFAATAKGKITCFGGANEYSQNRQ